MKKLLLILLPVTLFLVSCGGGEGDLQPIDPPTLSLEETLVAKKWCLSNEDEDGFILSPGGGFFTTKKCTPHDWEGSWFFEGNLIKYSYTQNSIQTTVLWGEVTEYSETEVKILEESSSTLTTEKVYYITPEDIFGCTDVDGSNYDSTATCDDGSCLIARTYIPDYAFERALINLGYDDLEDNYVKTANIQNITHLDISYSWPQISSLVGIQDFDSLKWLDCSNNRNIQNLDLRNNSQLEYLKAGDNKLSTLRIENLLKLQELNVFYNNLTSLNLSTNTALITLNCRNNNIQSLDAAYASYVICHNNNMYTFTSNNVINLDIEHNQLTELDLSNCISLNEVKCGGNNLSNLDLRNGNNINMTPLTLYNNPNLTCINVDDALYSTNNWTNISWLYYFSEDCP